MKQTKYKDALVYAFKLHEKQLRKGTSIPYFSHLAFTFTLSLKGLNSNDFINYTDSELFSLKIL